MKIFVSVGTKCSIAGWGTTEKGVARPRKLRNVKVPVVDLETCRKNEWLTSVSDNLTECVRKSIEWVFIRCSVIPLNGSKSLQPNLGQ